MRGFQFDWKRYRIPPKVAAAMDESQQWAVTIADEALTDYGYPDRPLDTERTGVILGTAMGGELHYITQNRVALPRVRPRAGSAVPEFAELPAPCAQAILEQWHARMDNKLPPITEDTMPGELANIVAGRVANVLNLRGPNFITDAACASSFRRHQRGLRDAHRAQRGRRDGRRRGPQHGRRQLREVLQDRRPERHRQPPLWRRRRRLRHGRRRGPFLLKRLADAERDGDSIYAVIRGVGGSSDGKGKGITAPNPVGQMLAVRRAWENAGSDPATATLVEAHGTSTGRRRGRGGEPDQDLRRCTPGTASPWARPRATSAT